MECKMVVPQHGSLLLRSGARWRASHSLNSPLLSIVTAIDALPKPDRLSYEPSDHKCVSRHYKWSFLSSSLLLLASASCIR